MAGNSNQERLHAVTLLSRDVRENLKIAITQKALHRTL